MTELEIKVAKERLKLETEHIELMKQKAQIEDKLWRLGISIRDLENSPEHYFDLKGRLEALFPEEKS